MPAVVAVAALPLVLDADPALACVVFGHGYPVFGGTDILSVILVPADRMSAT
jgi:hypothetical protein